MFAILALAAMLFQVAQPGVGAVQGTISRTSSGEPMRDVRVTLQQQVAGALPRLTQTTLSNSEGHFSFLDIPAGRYTVSVPREGFSTSPTLTATLTVASGATATANLSLIPDGIIRGRVLDSSGQFVPNATVQALSIVYEDGTPSLQPAFTRTTDDRGEYRLFGVPPGEYYVAAAPPQVALGPAAPTASVRNMRTFYRSSPTFADATMINVSAGEELAGIDLVLQSSLQVKVSGRVVVNIASPPNAETRPTDEPSSMAVFSLLPRDSNPLDSISRASSSVTFKGSVAEFEIQNVLSGQYDLFALVETPRGFTTGKAPVLVIDRDVTGIFVVTQAGVDLRGTVTVDGSAPSTLPEIFVRAVVSPSPTGFLMMRWPLDQAPGGFHFPDLPDGRFRLVFDLPANLYVQDVLQGGKSVYDSGFDVRAGPSQDALQVLLKTGAATMEGVVADATGKPMAGASVALVPLERRGNAALYRSAASDPTGKFAFTGITPGEYKLFAWAGNVKGAFFDFGFLAKYEEAGQRIIVASGSRHTVRVTALERK